MSSHVSVLSSADLTLAVFQCLLVSLSLLSLSKFSLPYSPFYISILSSDSYNMAVVIVTKSLSQSHPFPPVPPRFLRTRSALRDLSMAWGKYIYATLISKQLFCEFFSIYVYHKSVPASCDIHVRNHAQMENNLSGPEFSNCQHYALIYIYMIRIHRRQAVLSSAR